MKPSDYIEALERERAAVEVEQQNDVERGRKDRAALRKQQLADIDGELARVGGKQTAAKADRTEKAAAGDETA